MTELRSLTCSKCGADNREKNRYCSKCGEKIFKHCPKCRKEIELSSLHCPYCGENIAAGAKEREKAIADREALIQKYLLLKNERYNPAASRHQTIFSEYNNFNNSTLFLWPNVLLFYPILAGICGFIVYRFGLHPVFGFLPMYVGLILYHYVLPSIKSKSLRDQLTAAGEEIGSINNEMKPISDEISSLEQKYQLERVDL
jgi:hypothetical protein